MKREASELTMSITELTAQVAKLEGDRDAVRKWVKGEELKVDEIKAKNQIMLNEVHAAKGELGERQRKYQDLLSEISRKDKDSSGKLSQLRVEQESLEREKRSFNSYKKQAEENFSIKKDLLDARNVELSRKEKWVLKVFKELKEISNGD